MLIFGNNSQNENKKLFLRVSLKILRSKFEQNWSSGVGNNQHYRRTPEGKTKSKICSFFAIKGLSSIHKIKKNKYYDDICEYSVHSKSLLRFNKLSIKGSFSF